MKEEIKEMSFEYPYTKEVAISTVKCLISSLEETKYKDEVIDLKFILQEYLKLQAQLDIANNKLKEVKERCNFWISDEHKLNAEYKLNDFLEELLSIIGGE